MRMDREGKHIVTRSTVYDRTYFSNFCCWRSDAIDVLTSSMQFVHCLNLSRDAPLTFLTESSLPLHIVPGLFALSIPPMLADGDEVNVYLLIRNLSRPHPPTAEALWLCRNMIYRCGSLYKVYVKLAKLPLGCRFSAKFRVV